MNKNKLWMLLIVAGVLLLIGIIAFRLGKQSASRLNTSAPQQSPVTVLPSDSPELSATLPVVEPTISATGKLTAKIYFIKSNPTNLVLKPILTEINGTGDPHVLALEKLFTTLPDESGLQQVFNKETKVLGFNLKDKLAVVNFNHKLQELNVGASGEALVIAAIVNTLTKFSDVEKVKFQVEGEYIETLAGHVELMDNVFTYDSTMVEN